MSTTVKTLLSRVKSNLAEATRQRYLSGTATGGNTTTILASALNALYPDSAFVGAFARITSGNGAHFNQPMITSFSGATFTVTVAESFGITVANGMTFELFDRGLYGDYELLGYLNQEQEEMMNLLSTEALVTVVRKKNTSGTTGFAALPADFMRNAQDAVKIGGIVAPIYPLSESMVLDGDDAFTPGTTSEYAACYSAQDQGDGTFLQGIDYKPANNVTVTWHYIARPTAMTIDGNASLSDELLDIQVLGATARALLASEDHGLAAGWLKKRDQQIQAKNQISQGRTKNR